MVSRRSSGSERSPMAVEPTRSQKRTVTVFLTIVIAGSVRRELADGDHALERETGPRCTSGWNHHRARRLGRFRSPPGELVGNRFARSALRADLTDGFGPATAVPPNDA